MTGLAKHIFLGVAFGCLSCEHHPDTRRMLTEESTSNVFAAIQEYIDQYGKFPGRLEDLRFLSTNEKPLGVWKWEGPRDGWGTPFRYNVVGHLIRLESAGPDRRFGTKDDFAQQVELTSDPDIGVIHILQKK